MQHFRTRKKNSYVYSIAADRTRNKKLEHSFFEVWMWKFGIEFHQKWLQFYLYPSAFMIEVNALTV